MERSVKRTPAGFMILLAMCFHATTGLEYLHTDPRCHQCSPLLQEPWGNSAQRLVPVACPNDAWNEPGNDWVHCGLLGDWGPILMHGVGPHQTYSCNSAKMLSAMNWCWRPAHPGCVVDELALLRTSNETLVLAGDSTMQQTFHALRELLQVHDHTSSLLSHGNSSSSSQNVHMHMHGPLHNCTSEYNETLIPVHDCLRLPSGFTILSVLIKAKYVNKLLSVITHEEAIACRQAVSNHTLSPMVNVGFQASFNRCYDEAWVDVLSRADIFVFNWALWAPLVSMETSDEYDIAADNVMRHIKARFRGRKFIYRSTLMGHYDACRLGASQHHAPLSEPFPALNMGVIDHYAFFSSIAREQVWLQLSQKLGVAMHFLNVSSMMSQRIDGKIDCIHYCWLGPHWWLARIILTSALPR